MTTLQAGLHYNVSVICTEGVTTTMAMVEQIADGLVWFVVNGYPCEPVPVEEILEAVPVRE